MKAGLSDAQLDRTETTRCSRHGVRGLRGVYTAGVGYARAMTEDEQMRDKFGEEWVCFVIFLSRTYGLHP